MAIRQIRKDGDEILRKKSKVVDVVDDKIREILNDMEETMHAENGVGISAVKVGIIKRIVVIDIYDYNYYSLEDLEGEFLVILDHLEDPHNFGAIIRTCVAANIKSIIIPKDRSVKVTDVVIKTSVGTINYIKIIMVSNIADTIDKIKNMGYFIYAADMEGNDYRKIDYNGKKALVIGNEGKGVSKIVKETSDFLIRIPMNSKA